MIKIGDKVDISNGYAFKSSKYVEQGIRVVRITNVQKGEIQDDNPKFYSSDTKEELKSYLINEGDILMSLTGNVGRVGVFPKEFCPAYLNQRVARIRVKSQDLFQKYLFYMLNSEFFERDAIFNSSGIAQLNLSTKWVSKYKIPLPPPEQQKKIAAILDAADAYRQKTKALIDKYDELTQSLFLDMFGDPFTNKKDFPVFKLGELCEELFLGLTSKVDYVDEGGFPLIRAKDINKGVLSFDKVKYISEEQHSKLTARRITKRGDVLISKSGTLGTCAIVDSDREFSTYESIFTVRPKADLLSNTFLVYLVRNEGFKLKLLGNQVGGIVGHLNLKMFRGFEFPLPPVSQQNDFTIKAMAIESQKAQAQASLAQADNLFNSLLQKAFKGELVK